MTEYGTSEVFFKNRPVRSRFPFPRHASGPSFVPQAWPASASAKISEQATAKQRKSRMDAHAFATREKGGMNLSSRV